MVKNTANDKIELTDDVIAKALLQNIEYNKSLAYFDEWGNRKTVTVTDILNFVHRLQDDYSKLKERYVKVLGLNEKVIAEQKAEIERLSFYKTVFDKGLAVSLVNMQETIDKQKAEIERLTEELKYYRGELL